MQLFVTMLMLAGAAPPFVAIDDANLALTTCGYTAYREADAEDQPLEQFKRTLSARCAGQLSEMRKLTVEFQVAHRGLDRNAAERAGGNLISDFKTRLANQYANRKQLRDELEALGRAIRQEKEKSDSR